MLVSNSDYMRCPQKIFTDYHFRQIFFLCCYAVHAHLENVIYMNLVSRTMITHFKDG